MDTRQSEELALRQYLLGRLDAPSEITERLEERLLMDNDFAELADVIEDEIIEDYLEGNLDPKDHESVEKHFLRPPERREKLRLARIVNRNLESGVSAKPVDISSPARHKDSASSWRWPSMRVWVEIGACALLALTFVYAFKARREIQATRAQDGQQLAAERERSSAFEREAQDLRQLAQPATVMLKLLEPGVHRDESSSLPILQIGPHVQQIQVEIALQSIQRGSVNVRLEDSAGKTIWSGDSKSLFRSSNAVLLIVPAAGIRSGDYSFVAQEGGIGAMRFPFRVVSV